MATRGGREAVRQWGSETLHLRTSRVECKDKRWWRREQHKFVLVNSRLQSGDELFLVCYNSPCTHTSHSSRTETVHLGHFAMTMFLSCAESVGLRNKLWRRVEELRSDSFSSGIPCEFLCPITRELMREPVIAAGNVCGLTPTPSSLCCADTLAFLQQMDTRTKGKPSPPGSAPRTAPVPWPTSLWSPPCSPPTTPWRWPLTAGGAVSSQRDMDSQGGGRVVVSRGSCRSDLCYWYCDNSLRRKVCNIWPDLWFFFNGKSLIYCP